MQARHSYHRGPPGSTEQRRPAPGVPATPPDRPPDYQPGRKPHPDGGAPLALEPTSSSSAPSLSEPGPETKDSRVSGRLAGWLNEKGRPAGAGLARAGAWSARAAVSFARVLGRLAGAVFRALGWLLGTLLRGLVYLLASPVILLADLVQPDPRLDRSWVAGFMGFVTILILLTWGFGYLVAIDTLQGNALLSGYAKIGDDLAQVPYSSDIQLSAAEFGLDPALVAAIIAQESAFDPEAVSSAGARGLMQIVPATWRLLCPDSACDGRHRPPSCGPDCIFDPKANIRAGTRYFAGILDRFDGNAVLAFAAYNAGSAAVERYAGPEGAGADLENLPPFAETRAYVRRVLAFWIRLRSGNVPDVVTLSVRECLLLRQIATVLPVVVLVFWGLFAAWIARRLLHAEAGPPRAGTGAAL